MNKQHHDVHSPPLILIVEDSPTQAETLRYLLDEHDYRVLVAEDGRRALELLAQDKPDLVLSDIIMPEMNGYELCRHIKLDQTARNIPVILLTSLSDPEDVLEGLECGADYFITKPYNQGYLLKSVEQILRNRALIRKVGPRVGTEIWVGGKSRLITTDQQQTLSLLISTYEAAVRTNTELLRAQNELSSLNDQLEDLVKERTAALNEEIKERRRSEKRVSNLNRVLRAIHRVKELLSIERDPFVIAQGVCRILVERRGYDSALILLADGQEELRSFTSAGPNQLVKSLAGDAPGGLPACCQELDKLTAKFLLTQKGQACSTCPFKAEGEQNDIICGRIDYGDQRYGYLIVSMDHLMAVDQENQALFTSIAADVATALHNIEQAKAMEQTEKDKKRIEAELLHAQKMEAVGRLAGGVAHDFNNLLGVIVGRAELALSRVSPLDDLHKDLREILEASQRSSDLTRQLLAFSSRQIVAPKVLNLNQEVADQQKMLARLIGEDIEFKFIPGNDLWNLFMESSQMAQILANLAVNARDAIADTGVITIETSNVVLDEEYCKAYARAVPGEYVLLSFSDTGAGMDSELLTHIFEPFYTTKSEGKGTGLGLSTVFGIVQQYSGFIHTYSEPGLGTTFRIYLPRFTGEAPAPVKQAEARISQGSETVLLVEDEKQLLEITQKILKRFGYNVIAANTPSEACQLAMSYPDRIHLLLTDVVMPEMNGKELKGKIETVKPDIKTLFMSGYTANAIVHRGVLEKGTPFLNKPFTINDLTSKVREVLDG